MAGAAHAPALKDSTPDHLIGRVINERYKITALIAKGGMGRVYRAEQAPLGRVCAVKVLSPNYPGEQDPAFHKRFFLEASIASKLTHPNTVTIFDYGRTDDDIYFMAMEYLEGITLQRALRQTGPFPEDRALHIGRQICRAVREAHTLGVIHRDLKPANIFLLEHGDESDVVKVLDFGLVKELSDGGDEAKELTQTGLFMGSPKYMAPERVRGDKVDATTDIYSLGIILYEMLAGQVPFDRPSGVKILMAHVNEEPPPLRQTNPNINPSPAFEETVMRCLAKDPAARFRSMDEVLASLKRAGGPSMTASNGLGGSSEYPAGISGVYGSECGPERSATGPLIVPAALGDLTRSAAWGAQPAPKKISKWVWIGGAAGAVALAGIVTSGLVMRARHAKVAAIAPTAISSTPQFAEGVASPPPAALRGDGDSFHLTLSSDPPEAQVEWGGKPVGQTPMMVDLFPGPQTFVLSREGYFSATFITNVTDAMAGQNQSRTVVLVPRKGSLAANSPPRAAAPAELDRRAPAWRGAGAQPSPDRASAAMVSPSHPSAASPEPESGQRAGAGLFAGRSRHRDSRRISSPGERARECPCCSGGPSLRARHVPPHLDLGDRPGVVARGAHLRGRGSGGRQVHHHDGRHPPELPHHQGAAVHGQAGARLARLAPLFAGHVPGPRRRGGVRLQHEAKAKVGERRRAE